MIRDFFNGSKDDVLRQEFSKGTLLQPNDTAANLLSEAKALLKSWGNSWIETLAVTVPPGPYFYKDNALCKSYVSLTIIRGHFFSRFDQPKTEHMKPFAEWRIAVKDAFDVQGVKTSMYDKAYLEVYPPATLTTRSIINVMDGGASVLGKTKLSSFLSREEATGFIDYQAACNPRADGYQTTGGSSSGSAVAVAAYEWIDIGMGSDTNGSIKRPAQYNGVFGLRPSQGVFPHYGMFTEFKIFDVPGIFARDLDKLASFTTKCEYNIQAAWNQWWLSSILGAPEIVIPAGSIAYHSRISELDEQLPVTAQKLSAPGSDLELISMAQRFLKDIGRPTKVKTGRNMFTSAKET
ncbi:MAG: hypothetical protein Q9202_001162 [Teloschistes flavicans]